MSAFKDYYLVEVEYWIGRESSEQEKQVILEFYKESWHPKRIAKSILALNEMLFKLKKTSSVESIIKIIKEIG